MPTFAVRHGRPKAEANSPREASVRETERLVKRMLEGGDSKKPPGKPAQANGDIRRLEMEVSDKLGATVKVEHSKKGSGKLVISYNNLDELDGILKHIK